MTMRAPRLAACAVGTVLALPIVIAGALAAGLLALVLGTERIARPAVRVTLRRREPALAVLTVLLAAVVVALPGSATANVNGTQANSIGTAYPTTPRTIYSGDFQTQTETEYLSFQVTRVNQRFHFDVSNTTTHCTNPSSLTPCPVFATLVTAAGQQVGGEGSSAGTSEVDAGRSDVIDWTFRTTGTYYVAVDSSGDFPTFTVAYTRTDPPVIASLTARSPQYGKVVKGVVRLGRAVRRVDARLLYGTQTIGRRILRDLRSGRHTVYIKLNRAGRVLLSDKQRLRLRLKVTVTPRAGHVATRSLRVTLKR